MTAQFTEALNFRNEWLHMCTLPLETYFLYYCERRPDWGGSTALERGYVGHWAIQDRRLLLLGLRNETRFGREAIHLQDIFPGQEKVFAEWYSGVLRCPHGERLKYVHMGFQSVHEKDLYLIIENGVLIAEHLVNNLPPPPREANQFAIPAFLRNWEGYDLEDDRSGDV